MKGINTPIKIVMVLTVLVVVSVIVVSLLQGQNQNLVNFGTETLSGSFNNTTGG